MGRQRTRKWTASREAQPAGLSITRAACITAVNRLGRRRTWPLDNRALFSRCQAATGSRMHEKDTGTRRADHQSSCTKRPLNTLQRWGASISGSSTWARSRDLRIDNGMAFKRARMSHYRQVTRTDVFSSLAFELVWRARTYCSPAGITMEQLALPSQSLKLSADMSLWPQGLVGAQDCQMQT